MNIVYITDKGIDKSSIDINSLQLEGNSEYVSEMIFNTLKKLYNKVYFYNCIEDFSKNLHKHSNDVVFTTMYGNFSPNLNSKALVPSLCEANHIKCVGADSYAHMICNDKTLSKLYAQGYGIKSPSSILIRNANNNNELDLLSTLVYPVVIKPNYGGGSTAISKDNVQYTPDSAKQYIKKLYSTHRIPLIVEEYIEGYEIEFILFGNSNEIKLMHEVQLVIEDEIYFTNTIWGLETKKINDKNVEFENSNMISASQKNAMIKLFKSFEKMEFMRIDCRINSTGLYMLELSPDCYVGEDGALYFSFKEYGYSFEKMLTSVIENSISY